MTEYDPSNRAHIRIASKEAKLRDTQDAEVLQNIMSYEAGRAWMLTKLEACHIFSTTFAPNPTQTAFNEGARNIGLMLLNDIMKHCPDAYVLMMRERNARDSTSDARRERSDADRGRNNRRPVDPIIGDDTNVYGNGSVAAEYEPVDGLDEDNRVEG